MKALFNIRTFVFALTAIVFVSCSSEDAPESNTTNGVTIELKNYAQSSYEIELLDLVNSYRVSRGLNALSLIEHISYVSSGHNDYMITTNDIGHTGFEQRKSNLQNSLGAVLVGENVAYGFSSAQATLNGWIASPSHKANLEGNYSHYGLSVKQDNQGRKYYTLMMIRK